MNIFRKKDKEEYKVFETKAMGVIDIIAPSSISLSPNQLKLGKKIVKPFFIFSYPRYLSTGWFSSVINLDDPMDISIFVHPVETGTILKQLRRRVTEVEAEMMSRREKGLIRDPALETGYRDLEGLRDSLRTSQEKMFQLGVYLAVYGDEEKTLQEVEVALRSILESRLIYIKPTLYQQKEGFNSCAPYGMDQLKIHTAMNTGPLSSIFPFASFDLSSSDGVLYGVNRHNNSLILFDRFSLENANSIVFAKSGSGKSYAIKLEILRSLMMGVDVIILDPENEYKHLSDSVDGSFFNISLSSPNHVNPFDLPTPREGEKPEDVLRSNIINLVGLMRVMLKGLTPEEDGVIDIALTETYASKDITPETDSETWANNIPLMEDFESVLATMEGTDSLLKRIKKFTKGSFSNFFNQPTNISTDKPLIVFGIRDMEDELRPIAMFIVMRYIWNQVRSTLKKRILVVDEAWWIMQSEDGASFLFGMAKRARKYWLGVTTITQDVGDFMKSEYGKPIITNSSLQILLKQSPATIDLLQKTFNLTNEEKDLLLQAEVGEGIFFAGQKHVAIKVVASYTENQIITTNPEEMLKIKKAKQNE